MVKLSAFCVAVLFVVFNTSLAQAKEFPVQARLLAGITQANPTNLNDAITTQGLKKVDGVIQVGLEVTYPLLNYLNVGVRYTKRLADKDEDPSNPSTDYSTKIDQDSMLLLARVPFVKTDILRLDAFAGFGGANTTVKIKSATQDGELSRKAATGWFATPYTAVGGSLAIGFKQFYFFIEGGVENNKVDGFSRSGNVSASFDTLNLSGSYVNIGLMFDGVPGSFK